MKRIALVTGANKGIGFSIAQQLAEAGLDVIVGARDEAAGRAAAARIPGARALQLDVTSDASIAAAAAALDALDVLVNNAGISDREDGSAATLADTKIKVNAAAPGYTVTDLNRHLAAAQPGWTPPPGTQTTDDAARTPVRLALLPDDGPTGTFFDKTGHVPW